MAAKCKAQCTKQRLAEVGQQLAELGIAGNEFMGKITLKQNHNLHKLQMVWVGYQV